MESNNDLKQSAKEARQIARSMLELDVVKAVKKEETDYEEDDEVPEISPDHLTSYGETLMHLLRGNVGPGMFAMGDAFKNAGIIVAPPVLVFLGILCVHCEHLLLQASNEMKKRAVMHRAPGFGLTMELCCLTGHPSLKKMAKNMRRLCNAFLIVTQLGFCCVYFVFVSTNVKQVMDYYKIEINIHYHMAFLFLPILLTCLLRNLKYLAWFSTFANAVMAAGVLITFYYCVQDVPSITERSYVSSIERLPLFLGTAFFAFEGIGLVLPLQKEMKEPKKFVSTFGVLNIGMTGVIALFTCIGFMSYLKYGENIQGSITLNLPVEDVLAQIVKLMVGLAVMLTFALQMYIPVAILWPKIVHIFGPFTHPVFLELCFRTSFVLLTFILAEVVPYLGLFISLVGAISSTALALIFPPLLELMVYHGIEEMSPWIVIKDVFIILIGVVATITGTYASIVEIVNVFKTENL